MFVSSAADALCVMHYNNNNNNDNDNDNNNNNNTGLQNAKNLNNLKQSHFLQHLFQQLLMFKLSEQAISFSSAFVFTAADALCATTEKTGSPNGQNLEN